MSRRTRDEAPEEDAPKLDISSLIDATFLLLIYFLVTTTIQPREQDLPMSLPSNQGGSGVPEIEPKFIRVDASGAIYVGQGSAQIPMDADPEVRELPLLVEDLRTYKDAARAAGKDAIVQLYADSAASQQRVIDVLNALASLEIQSVTFTDLLDE